MKYCIPGELWNQVEVPVKDTEAVAISTYLPEIAYRLPSITDVMMAKEFWHTVCEFAERCGAMLERTSWGVSQSERTVTIDSPATFGAVQRFVGAGVDGRPVGFDRLDISAIERGYSVVFAMSSLSAGGEAVNSYVCYSVVPNINAEPDKQVAPKWFLKRYERLLIAGALMRICAMVDENWGDATAARLYATTYLRELDRVTHGLITSGMRKQVLLDAESVLARQSQTTNTTTNTNTVG